MKILIIDDSMDFRKLVCAMLGKKMQHAEIVEYDLETLGKPANNFPWYDYDVLLLDYNLGNGENGFVWLHEFIQLDNFPPTIILTGEGDTSIAVKAIKLGAVDYLNKVDVTPSHLMNTIHKALDYTPSVIEEQKEEIHDAENIVKKIYKNENKSLFDRGDDIGYKFVRKIGQGAMSKVYLSERKTDNLSVVLKVLDIKNTVESEIVDRFVLEAELIEKLDSPFVLKIHEHGMMKDYGFIVMEFFSRGDLKQRMELNIPPSLAVTYLLHTMYGLQAIHEVGVVHRDLKPANIMFRGDDSMALVDFGISKNIHSGSNLTTMGKIMGTPHYMSPEQGQGLPIDGRSDLYSAGVMFYEMLVKEKPYNAKNPAALIEKHINEAIPKLPDELNKYQVVIDKLMAKNPEDRFQTASEAINTLLPLE